MNASGIDPMTSRRGQRGLFRLPRAPWKKACKCSVSLTSPTRSGPSRTSGRRPGLPKATGFRLVKTLENLKYLAFDPKTGTYHLGSAMMKAAYLTQTHAALVGAAEPYIQALADATTETVDLSVPTDQGAMIVHTVYSSRPFRPYNPPGLTMAGLDNVHCKIFVAFGPQTLWGTAIANTVPRTALSVTDPDRLAEELAEVRRQGVAFGLEEHKLGMCAVGAPVFDSTGDVRAALAVVVPVERFGEAESRRYAAAVIEEAVGLSRELGYAVHRPGHQISTAE